MRRSGLLSVLGAGLLAGCVADAPRDAAPPEARPERAPPVEEVEVSAASLELQEYYARVERGLLVRGLLRSDGGGPDVLYDGRDVATAFEKLALAQEFERFDASLISDVTPSFLRRWTGPIRIEPFFSPDVPPEAREADTAMIARFAQRLGRVTRHPISSVSANGNFRVMILSEDARRVIGPTLRRLMPGIGAQEVDAIQTLDRAAYCLIITSDPGNDGVITRAVAIVRAELPPALRTSCIHEEIAQGLGLGNDSPDARPSIFNDDDEFGRLTSMDEELLKLLYDPELRPGMDAVEAMPIVRRIVTDRLDGSA